ncbi:MAG: hypothetical protein COT25_03560 [Candidatus Kerfeldbacteria bacterium CG08_land_8_20_14_0_20_42_7]|uniref:DUF1622 domain-containing protein n=1 Tax=Candidatus Kerfeldbacteria bacterium CG08_land_8_20_14_0_20_42_7 TaxID=2014245 RepID=A0A2H0YSD0_9BACT|nr:MAG: hypothetical protein COT25_03560 [Candidatus Kerfeldbacteria bacterium CG08_land_8_20_14_0_20_42_7]
MQTFEPFVNFAIGLFRLVGFCVIVWGGARTVYYFFMPSLYPTLKNKKVSLEELLRIELGQKIVFGLEFLVAGDILITLKDPDVSELYRLGLLVVIRTLLSFFVGREVKESDIHVHQVERETVMKSGQPTSKK